MNVVQATPSEIWDPSVRKVEVRDENSKILGYLYLDLLARGGKFNGGANFPLRFRCMHSDVARVAVVTNFASSRAKEYVRQVYYIIISPSHYRIYILNR